MSQGGSVLIDVLANDAGTGVTLASVGRAAHGAAAIEDGKVRYTPAAGYAGADSFVYVAHNAGGDASAGVSVTVTAAPGTVLPPVVASTTLRVNPSAAAAPIGLAAPVSSTYTAAQLAVSITGLPAIGTVTLSDGSAVAAGQVLTPAQLAGLLFKPAPGLHDATAALTFVVTDPATNAVAGQATLVVGALQPPVVSSTTLSIPPGSLPRPIGIVPPTDPNDAADALVIVIRSLPSNGLVSLADGTPLAAGGLVLTPAQLAGLRFAPASGVAGTASTLVYAAIDRDGNSTAGVAVLSIAASTITPTLVLIPTSGDVAGERGIVTAGPTPVAGLAGRGTGVSVFLDGAATASATATGDGSATFGALPGVTTGFHSLVATAQDPGLSVSPGSDPVQVFAVSPPVNGVSAAPISSLDLSTLLATGYGLFLTPGTQAIQLVDGRLSVGADTDEAFVQRLYEGLLNRSYDQGGMTTWTQALATGTSRADVAASFLRSAEFLARDALPADDKAFVAWMYQHFLGRTPDAGEGGNWLAAIGAGIGRSALVASFALEGETKGHWAAQTAKVFSRDPAATLVHDLYEVGLGREVDAGGLATWTSLLKSSNDPAKVAALIAREPEFVARHAGQTDDAYIAQIFADGLGRTPTAGEASGMAGQLRSGAATRADLMLSVARMPETIAHLTSDSMNGQPVLARAPDVITVEGQTVSVQLRGSDPDRTPVTYAIVGAPAGVVLDAAGRLTWTPTGAQHADVTVSATDPAGLSARRSFAIDVLAAPPVLAVAGPAVATVGVETTVTLASSAVAPGAQVTGWTVSWGDGSTSSVPRSIAVQSARHSYAEAGQYTVQATAATVADGLFAATPLLVTARAAGATAAPEIGAGGLPVSYLGDGATTDLVFTATFDPALLGVAGAAPGPDLPAGSTVDFALEPETDSRVTARITIHAPSPIPAGNAVVALLQAGVPAGAAYGPTEVLRLAVAAIDGVPQSLPESAALRVMGQLITSSGADTVEAAATVPLFRVVGGAETFAFWRGADAVAAPDDAGPAVSASRPARRTPGSWLPQAWPRMRAAACRSRSASTAAWPPVQAASSSGSTRRRWSCKGRARRPGCRARRGCRRRRRGHGRLWRRQRAGLGRARAVRLQGRGIGRGRCRAHDRHLGRNDARRHQFAPASTDGGTVPRPAPVLIVTAPEDDLALDIGPASAARAARARLLGGTAA